MTTMPPLHARVTIASQIVMPGGLPRDGWCVIGRNTDRGTVTIARNGQRVNVYTSQIAWGAEK